MATNDINSMLTEGTREGVDMSGFKTNALTRTETWYIFDPEHWGAWTKMSTEGDNPFPLTGPVRPEYDYAGADVTFRITAVVDRMTPGLDNTTSTNSLLTTAAAKPFGALGVEGSTRLPPNQYSLVLPAFSDVRLIPVDACSGANNGTFDVAWRHHVDVDLPLYLASGALNNSCWYCAQLTTWQDPAFRQEGVSWLSTNSFLCPIPHGGGGYGGGGTGGGGTPHGH